MPFGPLSAVPRRRVVVTGMGLVTPVGTTASETWSALCRGVSGTHALDEVPYFLPFCLEERKMSDETRSALRQQLINALPCRVAASVREDGSGKPRFAPTPRAPRSFAFCSAATEEALGDAELLSTAGKQELLSGLNCDRVGVNIGTGIPSVADVADVAVLLHGNLKEAGVRYSQVHPFFVPKMLGNMAAGVTAIRYGITGPVGSSVAACATGAQCIGESAGWIRHGRADVVVCGATEASITPTSIAGFCRMRALCATFNDRPEKASRPFDTQRDGFVMGEGAGILVLEELEHARKRGAKIYAEVRGFGLACDAFDVAAPHPDGRGAGCCIQDALHDGGDVPAKVVGYINAHATGTMGDDIELTAVGRTLRPENESGSPLYVSSTKGSVGHLLGAAGSVEAAVAILALKHQQAPPCVNLDVHGSWKSANNSSSAAAFPTSPLIQVGTAMSIIRGNEPQPWAGEAAISTSFGFGGANTALLFTSAP